MKFLARLAEQAALEKQTKYGSFQYHPEAPNIFENMSLETAKQGGLWDCLEIEKNIMDQKFVIALTVVSELNVPFEAMPELLKRKKPEETLAKMMFERIAIDMQELEQVSKFWLQEHLKP